jgi:hypothetical protein
MPLCCFTDNLPNLDHAMAFTVPPGIAYKLDRIELTMAIYPDPYSCMCNQPLGVDVQLCSDVSGLPAASRTAHPWA